MYVYMMPYACVYALYPYICYTLQLIQSIYKLAATTLLVVSRLFKL
jgi:hypothetical protein